MSSISYKIKVAANRAALRARAALHPINQPGDRFRPPDVMPGTIPGEVKLAMDMDMSNAYRFMNGGGFEFCESFIGYNALSELTQRPEYRVVSEKPAEAMTRKFIKFSSKGEGDKSATIKILEDALIEFKVAERFQEAAKYDGWFGRAQLYVDLRMPNGMPMDDDEIQMPLITSKAKIPLGSLKGFKLIEPIVTYPDRYNSDNPMADDYYNPRVWYVLGRKVHASRLLLFVSRPVPDILKPAYNFGGLSMSQMAAPYIQNWLKTRTSVNRIISNFSTSGVLSNLQDVLAGGDGDDIIARAEFFSAMRDNQGLLLLDKDSEEFFQQNVPLSSLDKLQAQAQEHMASVSSIPLSILLGITPSGLNASSEGEIRIYYDYINGMQKNLFTKPLQRVIELIQLSKLGVIDPDISFEFLPLWQMDTQQIAKVRLDTAQADNLYFQMGSVSGEEIREKLAHDPDSGYSNLNTAIDADESLEPVDPDDMTEGVESGKTPV